MTRDEIMNMPAGRELDALVAEKVMGWVSNYDHWWKDNEGTHAGWIVVETGENCDGGWDVFSPSTDIAAAMQAMEKLAATGRWFIDTNHYKDGIMYWVMYDGGDPDHTFDYVYECTSLPEAICRVALLV